MGPFSSNLKEKTFKGLWFSDQHTLHNKTPTFWVLKNMSEFIYRAHDLKDIDIIVFGGDLFDRLVDAADGNLRLVQHWIRDFLIECNKHNVIVRVLEGTRSHDMEQPETFVVQKPEGLNLKWVKELSIEIIPELDLSVMYVPDNMGHMSNEQIWDKAVEKLSEAGLSKVNMIAFHGMWDYQAPPHIAHKYHNSELWSTIVDHIIFSGHVHIPSEYNKHRSSGSFDRCRHGEEHPKGGYEFEFNISQDYFKTKFWENKNALPYLTLRVSDEDDFDTLTDRLNKLIERNKLPHHSRIAVKGKNGALINGVVGWFKTTYPNFGFDVDTSETKNKLVDERMETEETYVGISADKDSLPGMLLDSIEEKHPDCPFTRDDLGETLKEFL